MSLVFLVGMPASGKSYWGELIAKEYGWFFVDVDEYIVSKKGKSIERIFSEKGEIYFRKFEEFNLAEIVDNNKNKNTIIATGGGAILSKKNWQLMNECGCVAYLEVPMPVLVKRIMGDKNKRPLLNNKRPLRIQLEEMYNIRHEFYQKADYFLTSENISVINFEQILKECTDKH